MYYGHYITTNFASCHTTVLVLVDAPMLFIVKFKASNDILIYNL